ncbi:MAG: GNAT family N-acetyltransferase [Phycisphaerales bacterium]|nr:GNAT family N-acetyltransferase [Phycisphaerales bacterium]
MTTPIHFGWEGEKVRLVPLDRDRHFQNCVRWVNDPYVTEWTLVGDFPITRLQEEAYFERHARQASPSDVVFAIETLSEEEEHIGLASLHQIDYRHGTAQTGTLIGRRKFWGQGFGTDAIRVRTRYAFEVLGLRLLLSEVMAPNVASLRALAHAGYREVGRIPDRHWKRGAYRDAVLLAHHRERYACEPNVP